MATENKKYIPALRFPEFQNDREWKEYPLGQIFSRITKRNSVNNQNVLTISAQYGLISQYDYFNKNVAAIDVSNYYHISKYDFAYNKSKSQGYPYGAIKPLKLYEVGVVSPLYICFRIKDDRSFINTFFEYYFESGLMHKEIDKISQEGARNHGLLNISTKDFFDKIILYIPSFGEQKKIAKCLASIDKEIDAAKRKLMLLKEHKKGLMQRLFPAKGKTIPELRFPEFQNDGEWNYEHGDMLYDSIVNKKHKSDLPILAITQDNGAIPRDDINYRVVVEDKSIEGYKVVEVGDFIISLRSFQGGIEYSRYKGLCSPAYIVLRKRHSKICDDFYRHYFKSFQYIQELNRNLEGIRDGKMVSYKQFTDIKLPYPSYEEQCKIAKVLSSIDDVIQTHIEKISALELHKNGLMQQLFPKL